MSKVLAHAATILDHLLEGVQRRRSLIKLKFLVHPFSQVQDSSKMGRSAGNDFFA